MSSSHMYTIEPWELQGQLKATLEEYEELVDDVVKKSTKEVAKKVKPTLKGYSKKGDKLYRTGAYRRGWGPRTINRKNIYQIMTYNKKKPTIVHLLEFGHGGPWKARPFPHVRETELKYLQELLDKLIKGVNK